MTYIPGGGGGGGNIATSGDVALNNPSDGEVLTFDQSVSKWKNAAAPGGGTVADGSITTAKLADDAVTAAKLADNAVSNAQVAAGAAIAQSKIANLTTDLTAKQNISEKGAANGYASLTASTVVPATQLGSGTANSTTYLRGDRTWATVAGGGGSTNASDLTSGQLAIDRLAEGSMVCVDKAKATFGSAAGAWPSARPTARTDIVIIWKGNTDPGSLAIEGDEWKVTS